MVFTVAQCRSHSGAVKREGGGPIPLEVCDWVSGSGGGGGYKDSSSPAPSQAVLALVAGVTHPDGVVPAPGGDRAGVGRAGAAD